jgi:hypothetical protein
MRPFPQSVNRNDLTAQGNRISLCVPSGANAESSSCAASDRLPTARRRTASWATCSRRSMPSSSRPASSPGSPRLDCVPQSAPTSSPSTARRCGAPIRRAGPRRRSTRSRRGRAGSAWSSAKPGGGEVQRDHRYPRAVELPEGERNRRPVAVAVVTGAQVSAERAKSCIRLRWPDGVATRGAALAYPLDMRWETIRRIRVRNPVQIGH